MFLILIQFPLPCSTSVVVTVNPPSPLLAGDRVTLSCKVETPRGSEKPVIHWLNPQGGKISKESDTITATGQSNGQWTCVVTNNGKVKTASVSIAVVGELLCMTMLAFVLSGKLSLCR